MYKGMNQEELKKFYAAQKEQMAAAKVRQADVFYTSLLVLFNRWMAAADVCNNDQPIYSRKRHKRVLKNSD